MSLKIMELVAENFKPLQVVEITPKGHIVPITGKNGQGKSSVLDAILFGLIGIKALPDEAVRRGAKAMKVSLKIGGQNGKGPLEFWIKRTLAEGGKLPTLVIEMIKGERDVTPQKFLDQLFDARTFDPLEFMQMSAEEQVQKLRGAARVETDDSFTNEKTGEVLTSFEAIDAANAADYEARGTLNKEAKALAAQIDAMEELAGLPEKPLDEAAIVEQLNDAGEANRRQQEVFRAKQELANDVTQARQKFEANERHAEGLSIRVARLTEELKDAKEALKTATAAGKTLGADLAQAEKLHEAAPNGEPIDVAALTTELQSIQRTNRRIEERDRKRALQAQLDAKQKAAQNLTRAMEAREEKKRNAVGKAKLPVEGLSFNDSMTKVLYNGLPLESEGEAGKLRISTLIGMKANPHLHDLCIKRGEALDEDGLAAIAELAKEHDFRIWMARVDSSGKVGIVLKDGMVVAVNEEAEA